MPRYVRFTQPVSSNRPTSVFYVTDTGRLPDTGEMIAGREIFRYTGKTAGSLLNVQRGQRGTQIETHWTGKPMFLITSTQVVNGTTIVKVDGGYF